MILGYRGGGPVEKYFFVGDSSLCCSQSSPLANLTYESAPDFQSTWQKTQTHMKSQRQFSLEGTGGWTVVLSPWKCQEAVGTSWELTWWFFSLKSPQQSKATQCEAKQSTRVLSPQRRLARQSEETVARQSKMNQCSRLSSHGGHVYILNIVSPFTCLL